MRLLKRKIENFLIAVSLVSLIVGAGVLLNSLNINSKAVKRSSFSEKTSSTPQLKKANESEKTPERSIAQQKKQPQPSQNKASRKVFTNRTLDSLVRCYEVEGLCGFSSTDPKAEHFAIGQEIKAELLVLEGNAREGDIKNEKLASIARRFLKTPDGHVKSAALHLLSSQDISEANLRSILSEIISYHDSSLIAHAMLELSRYKNQGYGDKIDKALINALKHGSLFVSEEIGKHLGPFINENNFNNYNRALSHLSLGSVAYQNLKNVLDDYIRQEDAA